MSDLSGVDLHKVDTVDEAQDFLRWLGERRPVLAIDTETTGLKWWTPNFVRLVQFGDAQTGWTVSARRWLGVIEEAMRRYDGPTVFHNASFDLHAFDAAGIARPRRVHDTMLMHHLVRNDASHSLKPISEQRFGPQATVGEKMLKAAFSKHGWWWDTVPEDFPPYGVYAAMDTVLTARLAEELWPQVDDTVYERELATMLLLNRAETRGMRIDPTYTELLRQTWVTEAAGLREELRAYGLENPSSGKQLAAFLSEECDWEPEDWTDTGLPKLDKVVLAELMGRTGLTADVATRVVRYRRLVKWVTTYLDTFLEDRDEYDRLHATIRTLGARTGRMSISEPPLQQLPRGPEVRRCIIPSEGHKLYGIDYDAQELRVFAHYSGEAGLINAINEGRDMHSYAASMAYGIPYEDVPKERRQIAKNVQYSRIYGAGPAKMAATAGVPESEIVNFINAYDQAFPDVDRFMRMVEGVARQRHRDTGRATINTWGGRTLGVQEDKTYSLVNYLIQGTCADLLKIKLLELEAAGFGDHIIIPVHDEVLFDFPEGPEGEAMAREAESILEERDAFDVVLSVEANGPADSWGELK